MILKTNLWKTALFFLVAIALWACSGNVRPSADAPEVVHFVFVSDMHYGTTRTFNGKVCTTEEVCMSMLEVINSLPDNYLPCDDGVGACHAIEGIEMIVNGGDVINRQEIGIQSAAISWEQFKTGFVDKVTTKTKAGEKTELYVLPGNHDVSNAIGYFQPMYPLTDASAMAGIYNLMFYPKIPMTAEKYNYAADKMNLSVERFNVCFFFVNIWPGTAERQWMATRLSELPPGTPALIFAHDPPDIPASHLTNPTPPHDINSIAQFSNMIPEMPASDGSAIDVQRGFSLFVAAHPNIKAYFHGHSNYTEFYVFTGPDDNIHLHTFRADSPMKGRYSANDQSLLSFIVASIDLSTLQMTVRECFWARGDRRIEWGQSKTINLETEI